MELRKKVKIRFEMFAKTILDKQGNESYIFNQQAMNDFLDSFENLAIPDVVVPKGMFYCWDSAVGEQVCDKQCVDCNNENKGKLQQ